MLTVILRLIIFLKIATPTPSFHFPKMLENMSLGGQMETHLLEIGEEAFHTVMVNFNMKMVINILDGSKKAL